MTVEEAIKSVKKSYQEAKEVWEGYGDVSTMFNLEAVGVLLSIVTKTEKKESEELEQRVKDLPSAEKTDSVLEDIKAEIEKHNIADFIAVQSVIEIIDKHISGKEKE